MVRFSSVVLLFELVLELIHSQIHLDELSGSGYIRTEIGVGTWYRLHDDCGIVFVVDDDTDVLEVLVHLPEPIEMNANIPLLRTAVTVEFGA
jgi:hypothetical protein